jgi:hypothetical protein
LMEAISMIEVISKLLEVSGLGSRVSGCGAEPET